MKASRSLCLRVRQAYKLLIDDDKQESPINYTQNREIELIKINSSIDISNFENEESDNKCLVVQETKPELITNQNELIDREIDTAFVNPIVVKEENKTEISLLPTEPVQTEILSKQNSETVIGDHKSTNNLVHQIDDSESFPVPEGCELLIDTDEDPELAARIDAELQSSFWGDPEERVITAPYIPPIPAGLEYTLVLDLDETLIHYKEDEEYYLVRPGVNTFLQELSLYYDIVLFTASVK